ncbi:MAG: septum site-determining protein MinC [Pseudomonadales bacterium]|nr:septum site-determining protein MinC [Pseudomonadales bacterium]
MTTTEKTAHEIKGSAVSDSKKLTSTGSSSTNSTSTQSTSTQSTSTFNLKGSLLTLMVLELHEFHFDRFNQQMTLATKRAPNFFQQTPVVISLEKLNDANEIIDFLDLTQLCQEYGLYPVAIKGGSEDHQLAAIVAGLPKIPANKSRPNSSREIKSRDTQNAVDSDSEQLGLEPRALEQQELDQDSQEKSPRTKDTEIKLSQKTSDAVATISTASKIVAKPVRSGQQVYAPGGDLIILAPVSAGAEVLADGNIHVYGPLRGRALAGVKGNTDARIFCHSLEAELISIAGHYKVSEDLRSQPLWKQPMQARLQSKHLIIEKI